MSNLLAIIIMFLSCLNAWLKGKMKFQIFVGVYFCQQNGLIDECVCVGILLFRN
jgi:hypothetical protein